MREPKTSPHPPRAARPDQVWQTLSPSQQQIIFQTLVRMCQTLAAHWSQEEKNEPDRAT